MTTLILILALGAVHGSAGHSVKCPCYSYAGTPGPITIPGEAVGVIENPYVNPQPPKQPWRILGPGETQQ